jgi:hypothetical protein
MAGIVVPGHLKERRSMPRVRFSSRSRSIRDSRPFAPTFVLLVVFVASSLVASNRATANHGPGASGGGSATISGETLKPGAFELSLREDYTEFQHFSKADALLRAQQGGDFDALRRSLLTTLELSCGVCEDFQVSAAIGYFAGRDFVGADDQGSVGTVDPHGLTDLVVTGKYRLLSGQPGNLALLAGVKLPVGRDDVRLSNGELLSPTDQPSSGAFDFPVGAAYSRFLTDRLTVDASALYTVRTEHDDFESGDRFDVGVALAWRLTDSVQHFPQTSLFGELNLVALQKDVDHHVADDNSGSETLYFTPGVRCRFTPRCALTLAPSLPVYEHRNGNQGRVEYKVAATLSFSF